MQTTQPSNPSSQPVVIVGAGPVGLVLAETLSYYDVPSLLVEKSLEPTHFPKMDITNVRTMEIFRKIGIADDLRHHGVPSKYSFDVAFSTGLDGIEITRWELPSVDEYRVSIAEHNDGTSPQEPYQRCSQAIFERFMRDRCTRNPLIDFRVGYSFESLTQNPRGVDARFVQTGNGPNSATDDTLEVHAEYLIGCDGGSSSVRKAIGAKLEGAAAVGDLFMVHFRSTDLASLHKQGQFWHIYFIDGTAIISQDEINTWTVHRLVGSETDADSIDPVAFVQEGLGTNVRIDQVLRTSRWNPNLLVADRFADGRVFLAGDSVHQVIPTGGYGMNTGVGDAFDIGWKLAAVIDGWGGPGLLDSYEPERRPVALRNRDRSGRHAAVQVMWRSNIDWELVRDRSVQGAAHRAELAELIQKARGENEDLGVELGYRHTDSPVVLPDKSGGVEPEWTEREYVPSTWPGSRAPSVMLDNGEWLFDLFGDGFTLVVDDSSGRCDSREESIRDFAQAAQDREMPLKVIRITELQVAAIYEKAMVLVRPDQHVAWRSDGLEAGAASQILDHIRGRTR